eukprot:1552291-Amphidinium_carterae.1
MRVYDGTHNDEHEVKVDVLGSDVKVVLLEDLDLVNLGELKKVLPPAPLLRVYRQHPQRRETMYKLTFPSPAL